MRVAARLENAKSRFVGTAEKLLLEEVQFRILPPPGICQMVPNKAEAGPGG
jgi:hypothetical protein